MTTEEFVPWLVTSEWDDRCNRTIERLIRQAGFRYQASVDHIDYSTEGGLQSHAAAGRAGILCLKGGTCSSPEARGLARAIWPQPWVQGLPERIQGAVCQHGKTYGTAQDGQDEGIILQELKKNRARGPAHTQ